ncbi:hypothetical protein [Rickettsiella endosymbiont of Dermanyssus gallinae]|uniref:hypothetical protein n=1 Tax=Rickettsiella endosymbiont of Dermanyssus gallinae TaxID=2856608 RepID=UPI001C52D3A6|nr:hypothetical protein [Rickettsiella endosymbiont of Dermanyssus gallinae]
MVQQEVNTTNESIPMQIEGASLAAQAPPEQRSKTTAQLYQASQETKAAGAVKTTEKTTDQSTEVPEVKPNLPTNDAEPIRSSGNASIDAGVAILQKATGITFDDVAAIVQKAVEHADTALVNEAYLKSKIPAEYQDLALSLAHQYVAGTIQESQAVVQEIYTMSGGAEKWSQMNDIFKSKAPPALMKAAKLMADGGDYKGYADIVLQYTAGLGVGAPIGAIAGNQAIGLLSRENFSKELNQLKQDAKGRSLESPQYRDRYSDLIRRRKMGKSAGL